MSYYRPEDLLNGPGTHLPPKDEEVWRDSHRRALIALAPLLDVARETAALLVPVQPRAQFRVELHRSLLASARQQKVQRALWLAVPDQPALLGRVNEWAEHGLSELSDTDRRLVVGAAVVGSALSVAGILRYVLRQRGRAAA
jgi:hypothetical protein